MKNWLRTYNVYRAIVIENKARFRRILDNRIYYWDEYRRELLPEVKTGQGYKAIELDELWEEVKEPVGFIEAVKSGKTLRIEHETIDGELEHISTCYHCLGDIVYELGNFLNDKDIREVILNGEWYIED